MHRGADAGGAVAEHRHLHAGRQGGLDLRQGLGDLVDGGDDVGAGLALDVEDDRRSGVHPRAQAAVLGPLDRHGHVAQADGRAVLIGHDHVHIAVDIGQLVVGVDVLRLGGAVERALGGVGVGVGDRGAQGLQRQAIGRRGLAVDADAHGRALAAGYGHHAHPADLRDLLGHPRLGQVLDLGQGHGLGGQGQGDDRRVGRVDLGVDRRRGQVGGQQVAAGVDRGLDLLLGDVQRQVEVELQGDDRGAARADGGHALEVGHLAELPLQRRGHRCGHHFGAGARIEGLHLDGRVVDLGQGRQRQELERHQAAQQDRRHQQRGRHRTDDEGT